MIYKNLVSQQKWQINKKLKIRMMNTVIK